MEIGSEIEIENEIESDCTIANESGCAREVVRYRKYKLNQQLGKNGLTLNPIYPIRPIYPCSLSTSTNLIPAMSAYDSSLQAI